MVAVVVVVVAKMNLLNCIQEHCVLFKIPQCVVETRRHNATRFRLESLRIIMIKEHEHVGTGSSCTMMRQNMMQAHDVSLAKVQREREK